MGEQHSFECVTNIGNQEQPAGCSFYMQRKPKGWSYASYSCWTGVHFGNFISFCRNAHLERDPHFLRAPARAEGSAVYAPTESFAPQAGLVILLKEAVEKFLSRFHESRDIDDVFTSGCCYWFAFILHKRFPGSIILYDPVANHFAVSIDGSAYDITGCLDGAASDNDCRFQPWDQYDDELDRARIIRDCIMF